MKRTVLILLTCIYSLSTFGVSLKQFYCCGKLKSVTISLAKDCRDKCSKGDNDDNCCKTKYQFFKVKDKHFASAQLAVKHYASPISFKPSYQNVFFVSEPVNIINGRHTPPLYSGVPIYISNCVFRV